MIRRSIALILALACSLSANAQDAATVKLVPKTEPAATVKVENLTPEYRAFRLGLSGGGGPFEYMLGIMPMMTRGSDSSNPGYLNFADVLFSKGEMTEVYGIRFLATYRLAISPARLTGGASTTPEVPSDELKLHLVRVDSIQSITPAPEITREVLEKALGVGAGKTVFDDAKQAAQRTQTLSNAKQVALSLMMYAADYDDVYPYAQWTKTVKEVTLPYLKNGDIWKSANPKGGEFFFNMALAGVTGSTIVNPSETVMLYESEEWPNGGRVIAYADGHAKFVKEDAIGVIRRSQALKMKRVGKPLPTGGGG